MKLLFWRLRAPLVMPLWLRPVREWVERVVYCHHNARVLADMEYRLSCVLDAATGGKMSKSYYTWEAMRPVISDHQTAQYSEGWNDALSEWRGRDQGELAEAGKTPGGYTIFRRENGVGGHRYFSDEIGGGVFVWDTSLVSPETLQACLVLEGVPNPAADMIAAARRVRALIAITSGRRRIAYISDVGPRGKEASRALKALRAAVDKLPPPMT